MRRQSRINSVVRSRLYSGLNMKSLIPAANWVSPVMMHAALIRRRTCSGLVMFGVGAWITSYSAGEHFFGATSDRMVGGSCNLSSNDLSLMMCKYASQVFSMSLGTGCLRTGNKLFLSCDVQMSAADLFMSAVSVGQFGDPHRNRRLRAGSLPVLIWRSSST